MGIINTVLGEITPAQLGNVLMHEHIFCSAFQKDYTQVDRDAILQRGHILLAEARDEGIGAILDATPLQLGRDLALMYEISRRSGVHIIACTGTYHFYSPELDALSTEAIAGRMIDAYDRGFPGTSIRPGAIKCAVQNEITPYHRKLLNAAAYAHCQTGLPVTTHSCQRTALEMQHILLCEGVPPEKLVIGHVGDYDDLPLQIKLLQNGAFIGVDRMHDPQASIQLLARLCEAGYANRIVLGHDRAVFMDFRNPDLSVAEVWQNQNNAHTRQGRRHFLTVHDIVLQGLREVGMTATQIETMLRHNPARIFS